jgi:PAS domain S-box-containing protein
MYVASGLALALCIVTFGLLRQHALRKRLAHQSRQISESEAILAEAQRIAHLGNWQYDLPTKKISCSAETMRIIERDQKRGPPSYFHLLGMMPRMERNLVHRAITGALLDGIACDVTIPFQTGPLTIKNLHITARPIRNSAGNIEGLFGTVQDITRQKAAEEGLRAREQLLRALYENVPTAMGVVERAGSSYRYISANPSTARLLGLHTTSLAGRILAELPLPTAIVDFWSEWFKQGGNQSEIFKTECHHEASRRHYSITLVPLGTETDAKRQLCFLIDDITERKEIDSEIAQGRRLRAIGELVGGIAHEFNNLLTPIMLKTELLASEWSKNPRLLDELQTIARASKRGADLTRRLLTFGRKTDARAEEIRLHAIIRANFDLLGQTVDRRISLVMAVPETLPPVFLNPTDLHQVVLNLLLNARDTLVEKLASNTSTQWAAQITVDAAELNSPLVDSNPPMPIPSATRWLRLTVRDNGMGMPAEVQERIFEPFYTTKEVGKGTGLGLATVWHLVSRLGGKTTVDSEPGKGSSFHVWLPVTAAQPSSSSTKPPIEKQPAKAIASIFFVEDDELVARTVTALLRRMGHQVTHQTNGNDAWNHLSTNSAYDLLLLDLDLPGINGLEIARRARGANYRGRILIASGRLSEADSLELDSLNVDGKLQKPFTPQTLSTAIQDCLSGKAQ